MRRLKDRDFLRTLEGFLFCVVGYSHPRDRVVSYLKYVPSDGGKWGRGDQRYARTMPNYTMPSLLSNIEMLRKNYPQYVFLSRIFNIQMSAVPHNRIAERYFPEQKLQALFNSKKLDPLQEVTIELVSLLSNETGVSRDHFGVTGSTLTEIHNPRFSDIDLTVYGRADAWKVKEALKQVVENTMLQRPSKQQRRKTLERWVRDYPLTLSEAEVIYGHRWNYGRFKGRLFSVHAVRKDEEIAERYGEKRYFPREIIEGKAEIAGIEESLFLPCTYRVEGLQVELESEMKTVDELVSYDGMYAGLFDCGEYVSVRGKLEAVVDRKGNSYLRVLIGSPEAKGRDYIKPLHPIHSHALPCQRQQSTCAQFPPFPQREKPPSHPAYTPPQQSPQLLIDKLGIKEDFRIIILSPPQDYDKVLGRLPESVTVMKELEGPLDFIHFFTRKREDLEEGFPRLKRELSQKGMLWVSWPKGSSRVETDLDENVVGEVGLKNGLVDVKICAVDETWSGMKFVYRLRDRK